MEKIIIFGGSFDPIHNGHINIALKAMEKINATKVFFVLSSYSPTKKKYRASWNDRLEMLNIAISKYEKFFSCEFENSNEEISYTWKTIEFFKNKFKGANLFFLMGSDQYLNFSNWNNTEYILNNCKIICNSRKNYLIDDKNVIFIQDCVNISSTNSIIDPKDNLDKDVINYINSNAIYFLERLKSQHLTKERVNHCIEVANLSKDFAFKFGEEIIKKSYCAGIYHDIAKEIPKEKLVKYAKEVLNYNSYPSWKVIHAPMGKYILENFFLFNDDDILNAIYYHSIPNEVPTIVEKIVFCADKLSYRKNREIDLELIEICKKDINKGFEIILKKNEEWIRK